MSDAIAQLPAKPVTAPASPKPAAVPSKPAAPTPSTAPQKQPAPTVVTKSESNEFDDIDAKLYPKPKVVEKPAKPADTDDTVDEEDDMLEAEHTSDSDKPEPKVEANGKEKRMVESPKSLRNKFEQTLKELKAAREASAVHEAKMAELETRSREATTLSERLAAVERERDAARAESMGLKQEVSPEFEAKYVKPFNDAAESAKRFIVDLDIDNGDGTMRKASWDKDFREIYFLPEGQALKRSQELFGDLYAQRVMSRYDRLHMLQETQESARQQERNQWQQRRAEQEAAAVRQREESVAAFHSAEKNLKEKYPDWFGDDPNDPEGTELVKSMAQKLMERPKSLQEHVAKQARIKLAAETYPRIVHRLNKANERIAELEAKLAEMADSEPGKTKRHAPASGKGDEEDWDSGLNALRHIR